MKDGKARTSKEIVIGTSVTNANRELRKLVAKGYKFVSEWRIVDGVRYKVWKLKIK